MGGGSKPGKNMLKIALFMAPQRPCPPPALPLDANNGLHETQSCLQVQISQSGAYRSKTATLIYCWQVLDYK
jgi:hypothetical protein